MHITVKLFATYRNGRFDQKTGVYPAGTSVADIANELKLPMSELGIILVNNRHVRIDHLLAEGDTLALFPLLGGG